MQVVTYDEADVFETPKEAEELAYTFRQDLVGDNFEMFSGLDNIALTERLKEHRIIPEDSKPSPEGCCFYIYFPTRASARSFIQKLNHYIEAKAKKFREAGDF